MSGDEGLADAGRPGPGPRARDGTSGRVATALTRLGATRPLRTPLALLPLLGIFGAEYALYAGRMDVAIWVHFVTLLACAVGPVLRESETTLFAAFALVPVFRLTNLAMPVFVELTLYWYPLIYLPVIPAALLLVRRVDELDLRFRPDLGVVDLLLALLMAAPLAYLEYTIIEPTALIPEWTLLQLGLLAVVMLGFVGFGEELVFRGILQTALEHRLGSLPGLVLASAVFGAMHSAYAVQVEVFFAGAIGFLFGLLYVWSHSLYLVSLTHGLLNVFLFGIYPFTFEHGKLVVTVPGL